MFVAEKRDGIAAIAIMDETVTRHAFVTELDVLAISDQRLRYEMETRRTRREEKGSRCDQDS
jgi:hypothetical protein